MFLIALTRRVLVTAVPAAVALLATRADASLIAHWQAEGNANDSAGTHHGTMLGGAGFGPGVFGQAFQFNGNPQHMNAPDDPAWAFGANPFSMSLWVNFASINSGGMGQLPNVFLGQDDGGGGANKFVFGYDGAGTVFFHINGPGLAFITAPTAFNPSTGSWHMYTMTRSASTYTFYADGNSLGTASNGLILPDCIQPMEIGMAEGLGWLNARVDDTRIYDHALSASEVAGLVPEPASLVVIAGGIGVLLALRGRR